MRHFAFLGILGLAACGGTSLPEIGQSLGTTVPDEIRTPPTSGPASPPSSGPAAQSTDVNFASLLNNLRIGSGVAAVTYDGRLDRAAQLYAEELLRDNRLNHRGLDGSTIGTRADAQGYNWTYIAENIAQGQITVSEVLSDWQGSPGHRDNNLSPNAEDFGLGIAGEGGQRRWVLMLGAE